MFGYYYITFIHGLQTFVCILPKKFFPIPCIGRHNLEKIRIETGAYAHMSRLSRKDEQYEKKTATPL